MVDQNKIENFKHSGEYLPKIMRDFHNAKDVFKHLVGNYEIGDPCKKEIDWVAGQCYIIDWFLWKMANYGYTLQKSHKHIDFYDAEQIIEDKKNKESDIFVQLINNYAKERDEQ